MKYYIAADGGGSKLDAILYDENFNIVSSARFAGTNHNFRSIEDINQDAKRLAEELIPDYIKEIEGVDVSIVGDSSVILNAFSNRATLNDARAHEESLASIASACVKWGVVAQAGTGSDAFYIQPNGCTVVGGWGAMLGDEGSGYDIGIRSIKAAIYAQDGRGQSTEILPLLMKEWKLDRLWDVIQTIHQSKDYRRLIASVTYITAKAAELGDKVAISIFESAAAELAHQVLTSIRVNGGSFIGPIIASGGAWKSSPYFFDAFKRIIHENLPDATVIRPIFSPVIGVAFIRHSKNSPDTDKLIEVFKDKFRNYLI